MKRVEEVIGKASRIDLFTIDEQMYWANEYAQWIKYDAHRFKRSTKVELTANFYDARTWAEEQFGDNNFINLHNVFVFTCGEDAMMFKMRWA